MSDVTPDRSREPLAIIGIGCRFPGGVNSPNAFWNLLANGVDAVEEVPDERWSKSRYHHPDLGVPGKIVSRWGGFVEDFDLFDARFFGISPREAHIMDPQQRWILEVAYEAIEDAGLPLSKLAGAACGVFLGASTNDFTLLQSRDRLAADLHSASGGSLSIIANRVSYAFDLKGPSMVIDTACSSSLVAINRACESLWSGESSIVLAGGVNAILGPGTTLSFSQALMLSPHGRCFAFDERADGYVRSEGAGIVVLKPLQRALADQDRVYAVILSSVINQDGHTSSLSVPSEESQRQMLHQAYAMAKVRPNQVSYVEAHGTGTAVGDPIEARAIGTALGVGRAGGNECVIGSVKTNIGHLESASGIAGLIKVALMLQANQIVPNLHFRNPNPHIPFEDLKLRVPMFCEPLGSGESNVIAGVNSFGFGGANAHVVLTCSKGPEKSPPLYVSTKSSCTDFPYMLPLSARSSESLLRYAAGFKDVFDELPSEQLHDLCAQVALRRSHHSKRKLLFATSQEQLRDLIDELDLNNQGPLTPVGRLALVLTGQGPQWWGMAQELLKLDSFRRPVQLCDEVFQPLAGWSLIDELAADGSSSRLNETARAQPAIFALQIGIAAVLKEFGVVPEAITGHSVGEVSAAYIGGALDLEAAVQVIYHRSRLQQRAHGKGAMAVIGKSGEALALVLSEFEGRVEIAALNSPSLTTLSGDSDAIAEMLDRFGSEQVFVRSLGVDYAFHSHHMDEYEAELKDSLSAIVPSQSTVPIYSTVTGGTLNGVELDGEYWWRNIREPVNLNHAVSAMIEDGLNSFLELGPHPALGSALLEGLTTAGVKGDVFPTLRRDRNGIESIATTVSKLYEQGYNVDWERYYGLSACAYRELPRYQWQRDRFWKESAESRSMRTLPADHPLLGERQVAPSFEWRSDLDLRAVPFLGDHQIQGRTIFPAAGFIEMALAVGKEVHGVGEFELQQFELVNPLFLRPEGSIRLHTELDLSSRIIEISSSSPNSDYQRWTLNARCHLIHRTLKREETQDHRNLLQELKEQDSSLEVGHARFYEQLEGAGYHYGPHFQLIESLWAKDQDAIGELCLAQSISPYLEEYLFSPNLMDCCFQCIAAFSKEWHGEEHPAIFLPTRYREIRLYGDMPSKVFSHVRAKALEGDTIVVDVDVFDSSGHLVACVRDFELTRMEHQVRSGLSEDCFYRFSWELTSLPEQDSLGREADEKSDGSWLLFEDEHGLARAVGGILSEQGYNCIFLRSSEQFERKDGSLYLLDGGEVEHFQLLCTELLAEAHKLVGVVHLWNLGCVSKEITTDTLLESQRRGCLSMLHLLQAVQSDVSLGDPSLWIVTRGVANSLEESEVQHLEGSLLWGMGRVLMNERGAGCFLLDLDPKDHPYDQLEAEAQKLYQELANTTTSCEEIAWRGEQRYVNRFSRVFPSRLPTKIETVPRGDSTFPFHVEGGAGNSLESVVLREGELQTVGADEIKVEVSAAGLNFRDVLKVLGIYPRDTPDARLLGDECVGRIVETGSNVKRFRVNDDVLVVQPGCFRSHVNTSEQTAWPLPDGLSPEAAATMPVAFLTAYYGLIEIGRLQRGEKVLIHAAAGGVGQAAVQIAQMLGAEIYATAGSDQKRDYLRSLGITHVLSSRDLEFAEYIQNQSDGRGVDVVLNSLAGEFLWKSLSVLAPNGRFLELGKRDIQEHRRLDLSLFKENRSFHAIDLSVLFRESFREEMSGQRERGQVLFQEVLDLFKDRKLQPLPHTIFPVSEVKQAFQHMSQAKHTGKVVLQFQQEVTPVHSQIRDTIQLRPDATYLITGGTSGFGLEIANRLVQRGAQHLVLMSRSGVKEDEAQQKIDQLRDQNVAVTVCRGDVTSKKDLHRAIQQGGQPLRGIVHAAMVMDDGLIHQLNRERFEAVTAPKMLGAWHLHSITSELELDFFILTSSMSCLLGTVGQTNYAAANAFLDQLAAYRRSNGLPALSINFGVLSDAGYLTRNEKLADFVTKSSGVKGFTVEQALDLMEVLILREISQIGAIQIDWNFLAERESFRHQQHRFEHILRELDTSALGSRKSGALLAQLRSASEEDAILVLNHYLRSQVAKALADQPENIDLQTNLLDLGMDSLMAFQLKTEIDEELGITLQPAEFMNVPSVSELGAVILRLVQEEESTAEDHASAGNEL